MTLVASLQVLLSRYADQDDVLVGASRRSRDRVEDGVLSGPRTCTVMLRNDLSGDPSFRELLARVHEGQREAMAHQDLPFERLVEELGLDRNSGQPPLPQVMFTLIESAVPSLEGDDLLRSHPDPEAGPDCDLALSVVEGAEDLTGTLTYNADLFESPTIARMAGHLRTLLEGIVANPEERLSALPILTQAEQHQLLVEWNDTRADYPKDSCIHRLFERQVESTPDAVALASAAQRLTYRELNRRSNQLARRLQALGVGPEVLVGVCIERSVDMVVALLAVLKAGGAYVPIDPSYPKERLAFMLADAQAPLLLSRHELVTGFGSLSARVVLMDADAAEEAGEPGDNPESGVTPQNLAYVIYTSGSTGQPKGVMIPHRGLVNYLWWATETYAVADGSGAPLHTPLGFDLTITSLFPALLRGRTVVLVPEGIEALSNTLRASRNLSPVKITPAHLSLLSQSLPAGEAAGRARTLVIGGEALFWEQLAFWQRHAPETRLINEYGPTETVVGCCVYEASPGPSRSGPVPIGRPIANTRLYVLDRHRKPVPIGVPGELYIGGDGVARGYLNRPELTAASFVADPFSGIPGARLYKTGDRVRYLPDGNLEFLGRIDHQVKLRGFRVEPGEIEAVLGQHPVVQAVAVVARERAPGDTALVAYLEARASQAPPPAELRQYLAERLPAFMIPSAFVRLPTLPLSPTGKVDRHALPPPTRADYPVGESGSDSAGPRDATETRLIEIWEEVLQIHPIGVAEDFFDLGGHSLLVTQLIMRIEQAFGMRIPVTGLFMAPTIAQLARVLRSGGPAGRLATRDCDPTVRVPTAVLLCGCGGILSTTRASARPRSAVPRSPTGRHGAAGPVRARGRGRVLRADDPRGATLRPVPDRGMERAWGSRVRSRAATTSPG